MKLGKIISIIFVIAFLFMNNTYSQCDSIMYWKKDNSFTKYDTIGARIEMSMYINDSKLILEQYDHRKIRLIFAGYELVSNDSMKVSYNRIDMIEFVKRNKEAKCNYIFIPNLDYDRYINWKMNNDEIQFEFVLTEGQPETKKYILKKCDK